MIEIFRTNQIFATLLLLPYTFLIRIYSLIYPSSYKVKEYDTPFARTLFTEYLSSPLTQSIIACFFVFLIANFINRLIIQNRISKVQSLIPGLFFILISATIPETLICSPALLSCFFIMLGLLSINRIYKVNDSAVKIFNTGLYFALALMLYPANIFFWLLAVIAILILKSFKIRDILILTLGMAAPLFLLATYYYWIGEQTMIWEYFQFDRGIFRVFSNLILRSSIYLAVIGLIVIFSLVRYNRYTMKNAIQVQKKIDLIYWLMFFCMLNMFFVNEASLTHLIILALPLAMFLGLSFEKIKSGMLAELMHVMIVIAILVGHFVF